MPLAFEPIGIIHTPFKTLDGTPGQGTTASGAKGTVEVFPEFAEGLKDVETFSHIILLYRFDRGREVRLVRPAMPDKTPRGVFASRHPCRPNGIGMTVARLLGRSGNRLEVEGIDMLDGTPLLDIKPYIARFDCFPGANEGWLGK
jgi:tRNA-Thr(GGU) m(6)t(6)A37 methyltransferase TsaA